ncbi:CopG family transcriptional regulator [Streptomyces malaysiensis]|uniref:CopG family transcriptional regulator n=1 Tax=Streptomyces malaysiensis TaxID=92644 RepID=UPI0033F43C65
MYESSGKYSITTPQKITEAARVCNVPSRFSAYATHQVERDNLDELISIAEAEHGPIVEEETQAKRKQLLHARDQRLGA